MTNRKSHTPFRLVPKSTTLDDLERPIRILFHKRCVFRSHHKNWMKIDPCCQQQKCRPLTLVSVDLRFVRIFAGVLWRGVSNDSGIIENVDFHGFWTVRLRHLRKWGQHYYTILFSPLPPFQWPQNIWPWMTLTGYSALKFCFRAGLAGWDPATSENNCVKTNKDRHILSAVPIFGRDSSFWRYKVCADIRSGSLERRR